jgi:hypothetical protein
MYQGLLHTHSLLRWFLLIALIAAVVLAIKGLTGKKAYDATTDKFRKFTVIFAHVQLLIGLILYFISPMVQQGLSDMKAAMASKSLRFVTVEHTLMMLIAIVLITIGSVKAKRAADDAGKYKSLALWFGIALVLILAAIPWPFRAEIGKSLFPGM